MSDSEDSLRDSPIVADAAADANRVDEDVDMDLGASGAAAGTTTEEDLSALEHSINTKGRTSYYYAHHRNIVRHTGGDLLAYGEGPRFLGTAPAVETRTVLPVSQYSWLDDKKAVKVYIPLEDGTKLTEDNLQLSHEDKSVTLAINISEKTQLQFAVPKLYDEISGAKVTIKPNKLILSLTKKSDMTWHSLKTSA